MDRETVTSLVTNVNSDDGFTKIVINENTKVNKVKNGYPLEVHIDEDSISFVKSVGDVATFKYEDIVSISGE